MQRWYWHLIHCFPPGGMREAKCCSVRCIAPLQSPSRLPTAVQGLYCTLWKTELCIFSDDLIYAKLICSACRPKLLWPSTANTATSFLTDLLCAHSDSYPQSRRVWSGHGVMEKPHTPASSEIFLIDPTGQPHLGGWRPASRARSGSRLSKRDVHPQPDIQRCQPPQRRRAAIT